MSSVDTRARRLLMALEKRASEASEALTQLRMRIESLEALVGSYDPSVGRPSPVDEDPSGWES